MTSRDNAIAAAASATETVSLSGRAFIVDVLDAAHEAGHIVWADEVHDCEELRPAAMEMLRGGDHEGPCTNEDAPWDECETHVATYAQRRLRLAAVLLADGLDHHDDKGT